MNGCQIGGIENQYLAFLFEPFKELELPFIPRNRPLAGKVKIGVFLKAEPEGLTTEDTENTEGGRATEGRPEGRRSGRD